MTAEVENALVGKMKLVWESLPNSSQDLYKHGEPVNGQEHYKRYYPHTNGPTPSCLKLGSQERLNSSNEDNTNHISTNGYDSYPNSTNLLVNGDRVHIAGIEPGTEEQDPAELDIRSLATERGIYFPNFDITTQSANDHKHSLTNGKVNHNHVTDSHGSPTFDCALQALVWATQGKDIAVASCMKAPQESLPVAPLPMREADHIQVLVTGSSKLVGVVLSVLLPDMND